MEVKKRRPANFELTEYSPAFLDDVVWHVEVNNAGVTARRDIDKVTVTIEWKRLIGAAMYYGHQYTASNGQRTTVER